MVFQFNRILEYVWRNLEYLIQIKIKMAAIRTFKNMKILKKFEFLLILIVISG